MGGENGFNQQHSSGKYIYTHLFSFILISISLLKVTDVVLGGLVSKFDHIAVLFFSTKRDKEVGRRFPQARFPIPTSDGEKS